MSTFAFLESTFSFQSARLVSVYIDINRTLMQLLNCNKLMLFSGFFFCIFFFFLVKEIDFERNLESCKERHR